MVYSTGEFASLNLALHVGDNPSTVLKNRELWAETVGVEPGDMVCACQTHSDHIAVVDEGYRRPGSLITQPDCPIPMLWSRPSGSILDGFLCRLCSYTAVDRVRGCGPGA